MISVVVVVVVVVVVSNLHICPSDCVNPRGGFA